jgi:hypothetical protein
MSEVTCGQTKARISLRSCGLQVPKISDVARMSASDIRDCAMSAQSQRRFAEVAFAAAGVACPLFR